MYSTVNYIALIVSVGQFILITSDFLRPSLFPTYVPPYIRFVTDSSTIQVIPAELKPYLHWRAGHPQDSNTVNDVVQRSGNSLVIFENKISIGQKNHIFII